MIAGFLVASILLRHEASISFESAGITVAAFCDELARQTGKKFVAWDSVRTELVSLRLRNESLEDVLNRLQFVDRAKMEFDGTTYNVRPDESARAKLYADAMADRVKRIKELQEQMRKMLRTAPLNDAEAKRIARKISDLQTKENLYRDSDNRDREVNTWAQKQNQMMNLPLGNAMLQMFLAVSPEELASIRPDYHGVWSTSPTPVEHKSSIDLNVVYGQLSHDQQIWSDARSKFLTSPNINLGYFGINVNQAPATLRLEIGASTTEHMVLNFGGFDADGKSLFAVVAPTWNQFALDNPSGDFNSSGLKKHEVVPIHAATADVIRLWTSYPSNKEIESWRTDPEFQSLYFNPETHDPVAETFGKVALELAKIRNKDLMSVEDSTSISLLPENCVAKGMLDVTSVEEKLTNPPTTYPPLVEYGADNKWISIRPGMFSVFAGNDFDRAGLGKLIRTARDVHRLTVMDVAKFASFHPSPFGPWCGRAVRALPDLIPDLRGYPLLTAQAWPIMSFLGRLDDVQISLAQQPTGLALAGCTPSQLECLEADYQLGRFLYHGQSDRLQCRFTDALPNGLPGDGVLHLTVETGGSLRARIGENRGSAEVRYWSPEGLAARLIEKPGRERENSYNLLGVTPEDRESFVFSFQFPDETVIRSRIEDYAPTGKEVKTIDDLPEPLRSQTKAALERETAK